MRATILWKNQWRLRKVALLDGGLRPKIIAHLISLPSGRESICADGITPASCYQTGVKMPIDAFTLKNLDHRVCEKVKSIFIRAWGACLLRCGYERNNVKSTLINESHLLLCMLLDLIMRNNIPLQLVICVLSSQKRNPLVYLKTAKKYSDHSKRYL